ncbi:hypothetical protein T484DRAFT_1772916 [Baffinella frigidus]|nr:hypothetical protein T484DRAFT_1772916 [Cryptophyta sp. CCMP2293]
MRLALAIAAIFASGVMRGVEGSLEERALSRLRSLAVPYIYPPETLEAMDARVQQPQDIGEILSLMGRFESSAVVQAAGCWALYSRTGDAENEVAIAAKGGIEAIVKAMAAHGSNAGVQVAGCKALSGLAGNANNHLAMATKGGIDAIVMAMWTRRSNAGVQEDGCR